MTENIGEKRKNNKEVGDGDDEMVPKPVKRRCLQTDIRLFTVSGILAASNVAQPDQGVARLSQMQQQW